LAKGYEVHGIKRRASSFNTERMDHLSQGARKFLFWGSSCIYPNLAPQPLREDSPLTGPLEQTNEAYAVAKIAGLKMGQAYRAQASMQSSRCRRICTGQATIIIRRIRT
jgi:nucleoside-diphosphate-sugar epimerase